MTLPDAPPGRVLDPGPDVREALLAYLRENPATSYVCLAEVLGVTQSVVLAAVRSLQWDGLLTVRSGTRSDPVNRYTVNDPPATWDDADVWSAPDRPPIAPDEDDREPAPMVLFTACARSRAPRRGWLRDRPDRRGDTDGDDGGQTT
jgi:hypothetical protein